MEINRKWILSKTLIVAFFLSTPFLEGIFLTRRDNYRIGGWTDHKLAYIERKTFREKKPIDFLFLGHSGLWSSVNARLIENKLRQLNGREDIYVQNYGHIFAGLDTDYLLLEDVVKNRGVKNLFLGMPPMRQDYPHRAIRHLWNPWNSFDEVETGHYSMVYAEKILESFPSIVKNIRDFKFRDFVPFETYNGSLVVKAGYSEVEGLINKNAPFTPVSRNPLTISLNEVIIPPEALNSTVPFTSYQDHYFRKILALVKREKINLYFFVSPVNVPGEDLAKFFIMKDSHSMGIPYFGIPAAKLFPGESHQEMKKYFYNSRHTNANGSRYFSSTLVPALQEVYEKTHP